MQKVTLAILAGGKSSRLGGIDKAILTVDGIPLISRIYNTFRTEVWEVIVISNSSKTYPIDAPIFPDIILNCGPLGGIHSALTNASSSLVFIVSVDLPFASKDIFQQLLCIYQKNRAEIVVPKHGDLMEPLFGLYNKTLLSRVNSILADRQGHPISELISQSNTKYLELPDDFQTRMWFYNINTHEDLKALEL